MTQQPPIEHVVVLMLENRSFDHMLGRMTNPKVNGIVDAQGKPNSAYFNEWEETDADGKTTRVRDKVGSDAPFEVVIRDKKGFEGPSHSFPSVTTQLYGSKQPSAQALAAPAPLSGFILNYLNQLKGKKVGITDPTDEEARLPITSFKEDDLPVLWQLAEEFCVCDNWFAEVPGPTEPNRIFAHAATSLGLLFNPWGDMPIEARTIYQELEKAGRDWAFFYFDLSDSDNFPELKKRVERVLKFDEFWPKAKTGSLPSYSFLCPRYNDKPQGSCNSQHPPYDVRGGENLIADVYEALRASPVWDRTLFIVTSDEHGGFYDHVAPPTTGVSNPDPNGQNAPSDAVRQLANVNSHYSYALGPEYVFDFQRLGLRVPAVIVSPWVPKGTVDSTRYQHTSIMATLRDLFGVGTLTKRDAEASSFAKALSLAEPRTDTPVKLNRPPQPPPATEAEMKSRMTEPQTEMFSIVAHLDGHPDSGKEPPLPATREQAAEYIAERRAAHEQFHRERKRKAAYEVQRESDGRYTWQFRSDKGEVIARSAFDFASEAEAEVVISQLRDLASRARQVGP